MNQGQRTLHDKHLRCIHYILPPGGPELAQEHAMRSCKLHHMLEPLSTRQATACRRGWKQHIF